MCNELPGSLICSFVNEHSPASVIKNRCECVCLIRRDSSCWTVKAVKVCRVHPVTSHIDTSGRVCVLCVVSEHLGCVSVCVCVHVFSRTVSVSSVPCSCHPGAKSVPRSAKTVTLHHRHHCTSPPSHTQDTYTHKTLNNNGWGPRKLQLGRWQILRSFELFFNIGICNSL